jgi:hypothetical protein
MTQLGDLATALSPLSREEQRKGLAALQTVREHREALLALRKGRLFSPAGELLDELQEERSQQLP